MNLWQDRDGSSLFITDIGKNLSYLKWYSQFIVRILTILSRSHCTPRIHAQFWYSESEETTISPLHPMLLSEWVWRLDWRGMILRRPWAHPQITRAEITSSIEFREDVVVGIPYTRLYYVFEEHPLSIASFSVEVIFFAFLSFSWGTTFCLFVK